MYYFKDLYSFSQVPKALLSTPPKLLLQLCLRGGSLNQVEPVVVITPCIAFIHKKHKPPVLKTARFEHIYISKGCHTGDGIALYCLKFGTTP